MNNNNNFKSMTFVLFGMENCLPELPFDYKSLNRSFDLIDRKARIIIVYVLDRMISFSLWFWWSLYFGVEVASGEVRIIIMMIWWCRGLNNRFSFILQPKELWARTPYDHFCVNLVSHLGKRHQWLSFRIELISGPYYCETKKRVVISSDFTTSIKKHYVGRV